MQVQLAEDGGKSAGSVAVTPFAYLAAATKAALGVPFPYMPAQPFSRLAGINLRLT